MSNLKTIFCGTVSVENDEELASETSVVCLLFQTAFSQLFKFCAQLLYSSMNAKWSMKLQYFSFRGFANNKKAIVVFELGWVRFARVYL